MKKTALFLIAVAPLLGSCGWLQKIRAPKKEPEKPIVATSKLVGRIASIPTDRRFVLIESYGAWSVAAGTVLTTRGPEKRTANLLVTGEKLGQFAAADVQAGAVEVGDAVYSPPPVTTSSPSDSAPGTAEMPIQPKSQIFKDN